MKDEDKTKKQLIDELAALRQRNSELALPEIERIQAEEALRESEERYRSFVENFNGIAYRGDANFNIDFFHGSVRKITGYSEDDFIKGKVKWQDIIHKDDLSWILEDVKKAISEGLGTFVREYRLIRKDDSIVWVWESSQTLLDDTGQVIGAQGIFEDITERKNAERYIHTQAEVTKNMAEGAYIVGLHDVKIRWATPRFEAMFGYEPGEMIGRHASIVNAPTDLTSVERADEIMEVIRRTGGWRGEVNNIKKDGAPFWCNASVSVFTHPEYGEVLLAVHTDITERKQAEESLVASEERYRSLVNNVQLGILRSTPGPPGRILEANPAMEEITGYSREELIAMDTEELYVHLEERESILEELAMTREAVTRELRWRKKNGSEIVVLDRVNAVRDDAGKILYFDAIFEDITERKQLEEERQRAAKLESVGILAGGIAHDFNNLLTGIMGNIGLAKRHVEPKSKAMDRLAEAEKASVRAKDLTQQLLTFASGGAPIKETVSVAALISDSATFALRGSNVRVEFSLPDDLWLAEIDEGQISQVITNLVINANEAMPEGGVLNIGAKNTVIQRRGELPLPKGNYVEITIEDHGTGISKEHLDRIFDPYFSTKQKGSGLGLATAYSIIKNHGGYITAKSKLGVGTTFRIYLPASEKPIPKKEETAPVEALITRKGRVMVMDDEEVIRKLLHDELTDVGYEVELTVNGAQAIERYRKAKESGQPFDAVILDLTVPGGVGGKEVIRKLLEIDPNVKAIVSSGYSTDPIMAGFKEYGFSGVVAKPYTIALLEKTLHSIITGKG